MRPARARLPAAVVTLARRSHDYILAIRPKCLGRGSRHLQRCIRSARRTFACDTGRGDRFIHREHPIVSPDERTAVAAISVIKYKIAKDSYQPISEKYGLGILIACERDPLFDENTLTEIRDRVRNEMNRLRSVSKGFLMEVYLYQSPANGQPGVFHKLCEF